MQQVDSKVLHIDVCLNVWSDLFLASEMLRNNWPIGVQVISNWIIPKWTGLALFLVDRENTMDKDATSQFRHSSVYESILVFQAL